MRAAAAASEHPIPAHAVGEVAGTVLETITEPIDLAVVFVEASHTGAIEDISSALVDLLAPTHLIGSTACGVIAQDHEIEHRASISLWAAGGLDAAPIRIEPGQVTPVGGWPDDASTPTILLADPFTFDASATFDQLIEAGDPRSLHGGFASAAQLPGGNRLLLDGNIFDDGAVGVALGRHPIETIVSQGCRPIGQPFTVTAATGNVITELASLPPMERLRSIVESATPAERELLASGLQIGVVIDERRAEFSTGDFLIRGLLGADEQTGAMAIGAPVEVGTTVQFHVRDASTASEDLRRRLAGLHGAGALTFTCNGRGERLFGRPHHDAELVHHATGSNATAGMFCAGEIGPVNGMNHVHGFTASTLLFLD